MAEGPGFHNRGHQIFSTIRSLLTSLTTEPSNYDKIVPVIEYWIEYVLREQFTTTDELVEGISRMAWDQGNSYANIGRFFKEFHDAPHRSEQARSFVDKLCEHVIRWFAIASVEILQMDLNQWTWPLAVANNGGRGFIRAASFVGCLIEQDLLSHELVRRHLVKPLITHHYTTANDGVPRSVRVEAIYQLFISGGNALLRGLLEPDDVRICLDALGTHVGAIRGLDAEKLQDFREIHTTWLEQRENGNHTGAAETEESEGEEVEMVEVPPEIETPVAFAPQDLPTVETDTSPLPPTVLQDIAPSAILHDVGSSSEPFVDIPSTATSSPTMSISTVSDLTSTEFGEEIERGEGDSTATLSRHDTFYFEDGNVEIVCEATMFRVHSTTISFASSKLRDMLSPSALLGAPMPEGCPRVVFADSVEDFAVLLKMICMPGFPARHEVPEFGVFASLLRMSTKYGFSDVRNQLINDLKAAYPTKWKDFEAARTTGEDVFGMPKPYPNAVLNLFLTQNIKFAIPFAAYRASLAGFPALVSNSPFTALPRFTLASTVHGKGEILRMMIQAAYTIAYKENVHRVCPDKACGLNVGIKPIERRMEALTKLHDAMIVEGNVLAAPSLGDIVCAKCRKVIEESHAGWRRRCWDLLPVKFSVARCWDEV